MNYLNRFLKGAERACEWGVGDSEVFNPADWDMLTNLDNNTQEFMAFVKSSVIPPCITSFYERTGGHQHHASQCHIASVAMASQLYGFGEEVLRVPILTWLTFGAVYYEGQNIYDVTEDTMRSIVQKGFDRASKLNLHCWLILADMSIVDVTILASLQQKGLPIDPLTDKTAFIIQDGDAEGKLRYDPILVSDRLVHHIDRLVYSTTIPT